MFTAPHLASTWTIIHLHVARSITMAKRQTVGQYLSFNSPGDVDLSKSTKISSLASTSFISLRWQLLYDSIYPKSFSPPVRPILSDLPLASAKVMIVLFFDTRTWMTGISLNISPLNTAVFVFASGNILTLLKANNQRSMMIMATTTKNSNKLVKQRVNQGTIFASRSFIFLR